MFRYWSGKVMLDSFEANVDIVAERQENNKPVFWYGFGKIELTNTKDVYKNLGKQINTEIGCISIDRIGNNGVFVFTGLGDFNIVP